MVILYKKLIDTAAIISAYYTKRESKIRLSFTDFPIIFAIYNNSKVNIAPYHILATPSFTAASATAFATVSPILSSKA